MRKNKVRWGPIKAPAQTLTWNLIFAIVISFAGVLTAFCFFTMVVNATGIEEVEDAPLYTGTMASDIVDTVSPGDSENLLEGALEPEEGQLDAEGLGADSSDISALIPEGYDLYIMPTADETEVVYASDLVSFEQEPIVLDRYQYEILKRMEFMQYAQALIIALIFILIFKRK